jgi:hypothetical protein
VIEGDGRERLRRSAGGPDAVYLDPAGTGTERNRETCLEESERALSRLALDGRQEGHEGGGGRAVAVVSVNFPHGLGDASNFAHMIPLWTRRGHEVGVRCTPDKAPLFRAAGAHIVGHADADHPWLPPAHGEPHNSINHWGGNKAGHDPAQQPLPRVGTVAGVWDEFCNVSLSLDDQVRDEYAAVEKFLDKLPRPVILPPPAGLLPAEGACGECRAVVTDRPPPLS